MREYKGYQLRQTHEQFEKWMQRAGIPTEGMDVLYIAGNKHLIRIDGYTFCVYNYYVGTIRASNGYHFSGAKEVLTLPDRSKQHVYGYPEALKIIYDNWK